MSDIRSLNELADEINANAVAHGFWPPVGRNMGEMLMLAVSELAEALEEHRDGHPNVWFQHKAECAWFGVLPDLATEEKPKGCACQPKPEGTAVELADNIIRSLDTLRSLNVDIDHVVRLKMDYNASRPFKHGKAY